LEGDTLDTLSLEEMKQLEKTWASKMEVLKLTMEKEYEKRIEQKRCVICFNLPVAVVSIPCGHCTLCLECYTPVQQCPLCRKQITQHVKIFLP